MKKINIFFFITFFLISNVIADDNINFQKWKNSFKKRALENNISEKTFDLVMSNTRFLPNVIKYDRYQPEFYEDTKTYISKRSSSKKVKFGNQFYLENKNLINSIENKFDIEKELLLSLMGIETNFGTYVGKMDILSSLATLSYDKRRSEFFTKELLILLKLIDQNQIDYKSLYGSWAGAFGFFQFMPSTIQNHAIDFNNDNYIDLKNPGLSLSLLLAGPMTVIPLFLYVRGVELIGLGPTGMIFYITPTLQFILGYFYYGEDFSLVKFLSFIIIWIAVIIYLNDLYEKN